MAPLDDLNRLNTPAQYDQLAQSLYRFLPQGTTLAWAARPATRLSDLKIVVISLLIFNVFCLLVHTGIELGNRNRGGMDTEAIWRTFVALFFIGTPALLSFYGLTKMGTYVKNRIARSGASTTHFYIKPPGQPLQTYAFEDLNEFEITAVSGDHFRLHLQSTQEAIPEVFQDQYLLGTPEDMALLQQLYDEATAGAA